MKWKDIEGYEGLYQISDTGIVKSLARVRKTSSFYIQKERFLNNNVKDNGYLYVILCKNGTKKQFFVHRLVANAFICNPNEYPIVNHKDENPQNNNVENLEWCTYHYNNNYRSIGRRRNVKRLKPINQYTSDGEFVKEWQSSRDIHEVLGFNQTSITNACSGVNNHRLRGSIWRYK